MKNISNDVIITAIKSVENIILALIDSKKN